ncbi:succinate dehydrogenase assembly factor 2, mitochondrial [Basidiobolus meristosporus CBS 931.73]|uniref:Succinate dehydrogenase assembly factor 2, mitochondrial n=1 Tax=Basidiobolus meristosporus CBS 931.73 TaxID=1314790 RepID=A0A1Y1XY45_9FUNG|nr:succinate dehydrogenase assembly factor 2, mitochondrial [Basidiobolus meristosporus CBS 931.73]|eukprot:ORX90661.1 succinate dehydrogenase assembly factor 2, mitochondrial [Basidiobolus meristosporus CBS 931.73]
MHSLRAFSSLPRYTVLSQLRSRVSTRNLSSSILARSELYPNPGNGPVGTVDEFEKPYPTLPPIQRTNEGVEQKRARLLYQCRKRGILETDLLLSTFSKKYLPNMTEEELCEFDHFMDQPDWDIYYWCTSKKEAPEHISKLSIFKTLVEHSKNEQKVILRMPELK